MRNLLRRFGIQVMSSHELEKRLGFTYRDGFDDGRDDAPFLAGYWLGDVSRSVPGAPTRQET